MFDTLKEHGLDDPRKLAFAVEPDLAKFMVDVFKDEKVDKLVSDAFIKILDSLQSACDWEERERYSLQSEELSDFLAVTLERKEKRSVEEAEVAAPSAVGSWIRQKRPRTGMGCKSLEAKEAAIYEKWSRRFLRVLQASDAPALVAAAETGDSEKYLRGLLGGSRATTIAKRVRTWEGLGRWLRVCKGRVWPAGESDLVEYLWGQMAEKPSPSFPSSLLSSLAWMEARAGIAEAAKISNSEALKKVCEKESQEVERGADLRVCAPRMPVVMLGALEAAVSDSSLPTCLRVVAWARLVKVFGFLRADDLQRMAPDQIEITDGGLNGYLKRTKTSGAGKRIKVLYVHIPVSAWVLNKDWMVDGAHALDEICPF